MSLKAALSSTTSEPLGRRAWVNGRRLTRLLESDDGLQCAFITDREARAREIGDLPARSVEHDRVDRAAKVGECSWPEPDRGTATRARSRTARVSRE
jgi:hypothetical protein